MSLNSLKSIRTIIHCHLKLIMRKKKKKNLPCYLDTVGISRTKQRIQINKINTQVLTDK